MSSIESSEYGTESDEDYEGHAGGGRRLEMRQSASEVNDYAQAYASLDNDVLGDDSDDGEDDDFFLDTTMPGKRQSRGGKCRLRIVFTARHSLHNL